MVLSILQQQKHDYGDDPSQMQMSETRGKKNTHTPIDRFIVLGIRNLCLFVWGFGFFEVFGEGVDLVAAATTTTLLCMYYCCCCCCCCCTPPNNRQHFLLQNL
ncbi:unnamed protein product [Sphagnum troendelagicum]|uniref:Uncharacterized protein n=1 Tax=Sphagnum troendelagicum TaxID=128251 RepID=A0ABP0TW69_9BRYO